MFYASGLGHLVSSVSPPSGALPVGTILIEFVDDAAQSVGAAFETARLTTSLTQQLANTAELHRLRKSVAADCVEIVSSISS